VVRGGCLCGAVRYRIDGPLEFAEFCHCSMCRKAHGSAFSANVVTSTAYLKIDEGADLISEYQSSGNRRKCFCSRCGSQLFIRREDSAETLVVTLGTVDDDPGIRPSRHVFVDSMAPWHTISDGLPQFHIYPGYEPEGD
jgi:hypothetical protein